MGVLDNLVYKTPTGGNFGDTIIFLLIRVQAIILLGNYLQKSIATCWQRSKTICFYSCQINEISR